MDEKGASVNTEERVAIAERIIKTAEDYGIGRERIIVDCLTLNGIRPQNAGRDTLEAIRQVKAIWRKDDFGCKQYFPWFAGEKLLNRTFLAMALEAG